MDDFVLLRDERAKVHAHLCGSKTGVAGMGGLVHDPRRFDEILGWKAAAVYARSADGARFGHHRGFAQLGGAQAPANAVEPEPKMRRSNCSATCISQSEFPRK